MVGRKPSAPPVRRISERNFKEKLQQIVDAGSNSEKKSIYNGLKEYVRDVNIPVVVNGTTMEFFDYYVSLSFDPDIKIKSVQLTNSSAGITRVRVSQ